MPCRRHGYAQVRRYPPSNNGTTPKVWRISWSAPTCRHGSTDLLSVNYSNQLHSNQKGESRSWCIRVDRNKFRSSHQPLHPMTYPIPSGWFCISVSTTRWGRPVTNWCINPVVPVVLFPINPKSHEPGKHPLFSGHFTYHHQIRDLLIWQCVKTNSTPSVHIKNSWDLWMFIP